MHNKENKLVNANFRHSDNRQSKKIYFRNSVNDILKKFNKVRAKGSVASNSTSKTRARIIWQCLKQLKALGFQLSNINEFKERHVIAISKLWEQQKLSPSTIQTHISVLRILGNEWLKKPGMIRRTECYFSSEFNVKRSTIAIADKSWDGNNVNFEEVLSIVHSFDPYVSLCLMVMHAFGLRKKEAVMFQPHLSDHGILIKLSKGTKTGRERVVPVLSEYQKNVLSKVRAFVRLGESLANPNKTLKQNLRHFDYIMLKAGITKKTLGVTAYGLRHGYGHKRYLDLTGAEVPVKRSSVPVKNETDKQARLEISEELGHARTSITNTYFGKVKVMK